MKYLSSAQKESYQTDGYVVLSPFDSKEIKELDEEYAYIFRRKTNENLEATWDGNWCSNKNEMELQSIHGLQMHSAFFSKLLFNEKLLDACEDIIGSENILLHHTKAHFKPPGSGSPFPMHQDYHYFPYSKDSMVAIFISVDSSSPENGGLCVYPGSHLLGPQLDKSSAKGIHYLDQSKFTMDGSTPLSLEKGQVVIFSYLLIHGSYHNKSSVPRRMFLIQLVSAEDSSLDKEAHTSPCQGMVLRGKNIKRHADISKRHEY